MAIKIPLSLPEQNKVFKFNQQKLIMHVMRKIGVSRVLDYLNPELYATVSGSGLQEGML